RRLTSTQSVTSGSRSRAFRAGGQSSSRSTWRSTTSPRDYRLRSRSFRRRGQARVSSCRSTRSTGWRLFSRASTAASTSKPRPSSPTRFARSPNAWRPGPNTADRGRRQPETAAALRDSLARRGRPQRLGQFVGCTAELLLRDLVRVRDRLVECLVDRRIADEDQRGLAGIELLRGVLQLAARQRALPDELGKQVEAGVVDALDDVRLAVLLIDHRSVVLAHDVVVVQLAERIKVGQRR